MINKQPPEVFSKKGVLRNFVKLTGKHPCESPFLIKLQTSALQLYLKKTLAQVLPCEFREISKNTFFHRKPLVAASELTQNSTLRVTKHSHITSKLSKNIFESNWARTNCHDTRNRVHQN